jgi:hypothetical protein
MMVRFITRTLMAGAMLIAASAVSAATLDGASFQVDYLYPDTGSVYGGANGPIAGTVGAGVDATINVEGVTDIALDFDGLSLDVTLTTVLSNPTWTGAPFNGLRISFTDLPSDFTAFSLVDSSFGPITTSFSGTDLFINWNGASYVNGSNAAFAMDLAAPVPVPAALPMLLAGIAALGALHQRQKRRAPLGARASAA